jgi:hypothetical protein
MRVDTVARSNVTAQVLHMSADEVLRAFNSLRNQKFSVALWSASDVSFV